MSDVFTKRRPMINLDEFERRLCPSCSTDQKDGNPFAELLRIIGDKDESHETDFEPKTQLSASDGIAPVAALCPATRPRSPRNRCRPGALAGQANSTPPVPLHPATPLPAPWLYDNHIVILDLHDFVAGARFNAVMLLDEAGQLEIAHLETVLTREPSGQRSSTKGQPRQHILSAAISLRSKPDCWARCENKPRQRF